jgi:hypothetical protein
MDKLCSKCSGIFLSPFESKQKTAHQYDKVHLISILPIHSDSIASLFASKSLPCHLCVLLWDARAEYFELVLQREKESQASQKRGKVELRWRWESGEHGRRLSFFIIGGLEGENPDWNRDRSALLQEIHKSRVVFSMSKGELAQL